MIIVHIAFGFVLGSFFPSVLRRIKAFWVEYTTALKNKVKL